MKTKDKSDKIGKLLNTIFGLKQNHEEKVLNQ